MICIRGVFPAKRWLASGWSGRIDRQHTHSQRISHLVVVGDDVCDGVRKLDKAEKKRILVPLVVVYVPLRLCEWLHRARNPEAELKERLDLEVDR